MTRGRSSLIALIGLLGTIAVIGAVIMLPSLSDPCMNGGGGGGSCPALADVNGVRYEVSNGEVLQSISRVLSPYGTMSRTNVPSWFAGNGVMQIVGIDPSALLLGVAAEPASPTRHFILLFGPEDDDAWPTLCEYVTGMTRSAQPEC